MKVYAIQSKKGIMMSVGVSVNNQMIAVLVAMVACGILLSVTRHVKYVDIENCLCKKPLFCQIVLACEYQILNTTETSH